MSRKKEEAPTIRSLLEPLIRKAGVTKTAERAGLHQPNLSAWLNGRLHLSDDKIDRLCVVLGVRLTLKKYRAP